MRLDQIRGPARLPHVLKDRGGAEHRGQQDAVEETCYVGERRWHENGVAGAQAQQIRH